MFVPSDSTVPKLQTAKDLQGDASLHYDAEIELMNLILLSIPNDIYNSVDACTSAKDMWKMVKRLMRGTIQSKVDRETRFTNEFDQFVVEPGEALVSVYNRFAQLMDDLERNDMHFPIVTINTKFLNSLQLEWLKYIQQFEKLVNTSRAKKLEKSHDPLALVAHTGSSSRNTSSYYVTHPTSVVDYDDEYQQDDIQTNSKDPLTSAMLLLARAITQNFSNPTNNHLRTSSNTRNQEVIQGDQVNIQSRNSGNVGRNNRRAYVQDEVIEGANETGNVQRTFWNSSSGNTSTVQCYNCSGKGYYVRNCPKPRVQALKYFMEQLLLAKHDEARVILTDEQNDFLFADASRMEEIEDLSANICLMARIQPTNHSFDVGPSYDSAFQLKHGLGYSNPYTLKQAICQCPKLYLASSLGNSEIPLNVRDNEDNLDDASKSQQKMKEKMNDPIAVANKQNCWTIDYQQINALYKDFVPQKVLSAEQKYFPSSFIYSNKNLNATASILASMPTLGMYKVVTPQETQNAKCGLSSTRMNAASSVRRSINRDSHDKNSILANSKNSAKQVAVYVRKNKQTDNTFANVITNKENVIDVDVANAFKANNLLCVSCMENVLIPYHDKCHAHHRLNASRTLTTKSITPKSSNTTYVVLKTRFSKKSAQSKTLDTSFVVSKSKIDVRSASKAKNKVSSASKTNRRDLRNKSLSTYIKNKIRTSRIWQKWFESRTNVVWSPVNTNPNVHNRGSSKKPSVSAKKWVVKLPIYTNAVSSCVADEILEIIKKFIAQAQLNYKAKVYKIRIDNGTEFKNETLKAHYEKLGIMQGFSTARTPQQNGVVERRDLATACFTQNWSIIHTRYNKTSYELLRGRKPNVEYFHVFGSLCYPINDCDDLGKMKPKAGIGVFIVEPMNTPSKEDLDNLFGPMFEEYFRKKSSDTPINFVVQPTQLHEYLPSTSSISVEEHETPPIETTSDKQTSPISLLEADELHQENSANFDGNS
uniref:Retrovirus-related Pol polyprotein from transposon TNT 1-94 n=1 Tax=Tanacetum cinerariifolium TaxID=118510 RepID=A0A6L2NNW7_TANCI|nr:hypothetical protein [Tanacetum cinerariifolium]